MFRRSFKNIILMLLVATILWVYDLTQNTTASSAFEVWAAPALESISKKVNYERGNNAENNIQLRAARGEYESFQIVVQAPEEKLTNVNVVVSDLSNGERAILRENLTLYREHYVYVDRPSPPDLAANPTLGKGWYPDGLIPFNSATGEDLAGEIDAVPFDLTANQNQPIWVDIYVPRDTPPGKYQGTYTVKSDRGEKSGTIDLKVWDFELPVQPTMNSSFNVGLDRGDNLTEEFLKHKVMPGKQVNPKEHSELIEQYGLSSVRIPLWSGADYHTCKMDPAPTVKEIKQIAKQYSDRLLKYVFSADEIDECRDLEQPLKQWGKNIHQAGLEHLVVMSPRPELYDDIDIWVVQPQMYQNSQAEIAEVMERGDEVWFYTGHMTGYSPQWQIDMPPINFRIPQGFIAQSLKFTGVLYPQADNWAEEDDGSPMSSTDPWRKPSFFSLGDRIFPGDTMLVYPGAKVGVEGIVPSMRLKWIRDGIEDYEYIAILKRLGDEQWALDTSRTAASDWKNWTKDPQVLEETRTKLGNRIEQLTQN